MHEVFLGQLLRDYLTGEAIENTTYEDLRQSLARIFVEELGYSKAQLVPKVPVRFSRDGDMFERQADIVIYNDRGAPLLAVLFCAGQVNTFKREGLALARLLPNGPAPFLVITDTKTAILYNVASGDSMDEGMQALPPADRLTAMLQNTPHIHLSDKNIEMEKRILYAYSQFQKTCCEECVSVE